MNGELGRRLSANDPTGNGSVQLALQYELRRIGFGPKHMETKVPYNKKSNFHSRIAILIRSMFMRIELHC